MEQGPKIMSYQHALALAKSNKTTWIELQIWTLEDHFVSVAGDTLGPRRREFDTRLRNLGGYTIENLTTLGESFDMLADYDLEEESVKVFCRKNNIKLISYEFL